MIELILLLFVIGAVYAKYTGEHLVNEHDPTVASIAAIKSDTAIAHLWFEETIAGDRTVVFNDYWQLMEKVDDHIAEIRQHEYLVQSGEISGELHRLGKYVEAFKTTAGKRIANPRQGRIGSRLDQQFDTEFNNILATAGQIADILERHKEESLSALRMFVLLAIVVGLVVLMATLLSLWHSWRRRVYDADE